MWFKVYSLTKGYWAPRETQEKECFSSDDIRDAVGESLGSLVACAAKAKPRRLFCVMTTWGSATSELSFERGCPRSVGPFKRGLQFETRVVSVTTCLCHAYAKGRVL